MAFCRLPDGQLTVVVAASAGTAATTPRSDPSSRPAVSAAAVRNLIVLAPPAPAPAEVGALFHPCEESYRGQTGHSVRQAGLDGLLQTLLEDRRRQVAAGALQDGAQGVCRPAQAAGQGVGIVDGDEQRVDVVHRPQEFLALCDVAGTQPIKDVAAQLTRRFGESVQPRGVADAEFVG